MRRIQIIVNNGAGTGQAHRVWNETQRLLRGYKIKYVAHTTRYQGHATKLAEKISSMKGDGPYLSDRSWRRWNAQRGSEELQILTEYGLE